MITVSGATVYLLEKISYSLDKVGTIVVAILVISTLLNIYRHSAYYANVARNVGAKIEAGDTTVGISIVLKHLNEEAYSEYRAVKKWYRGIYGAVHFLWAVLILGFCALAISAY